MANDRLTARLAGVGVSRRWLVGFATLAVALAAAAWLWPVSAPHRNTGDADLSLGEPPQRPAPEDLTAFLDLKRWGGASLREANADAAARGNQRGPGLNPALKELGYVGLVVEAGTSTVLLTTADGTLARLHPGDALNDGRILVAIAHNSITLRAATATETEVLELFPRPSTAPSPDGTPTF